MNHSGQPTDRLSIEGVVRVLQIIIAAMSMGALIFTGIALVIGDWDPNNFGVLTIVACLFAVPTIAASVLAPKIVASSARKQLAQSSLELSHNSFAEVFQTTRIVSAAFCEGTTFLANIAYMSEGHYAALIVAVIALAALILRFPTASGAHDWAAEQFRLAKNGQ